MFETKILDEITEKGESGNNIICYLTKGTLKDFLQSLPKDYDDYEIQREIVTNIYLDNLIDTVLEKKHIPAIVLVAEEKEELKNMLICPKYQILDGLQRTARLKVIWDTFHLFEEIYKKNNDRNIINMSSIELARFLRTDLADIGSSTKILKKIIVCFSQKYNKDMTVFKNEIFSNVQWFEIWTNLSLNDQVEKMLIANAGHKQVSIRHQLELLFLNLYPKLKERQGSKFTVYREKEKSSIRFSRERQKGWFHFSHFISAVISFSKGSPLTTNSALVRNIQTQQMSSDENCSDETNKLFLNYEFLDMTIDFLVNLDDLIGGVHGSNDEAIKWLGKEGVVVGLFSALGKYAEEHFSKEPAQVFDVFLSLLRQNPNVLNISDYNIQRSYIDISKVNLGETIKQTVHNGVFDLLRRSSNIQKVDWKHWFQGGVL